MIKSLKWQCPHVKAFDDHNRKEAMAKVDHATNFADSIACANLQKFKGEEPLDAKKIAEAIDSTGAEVLTHSSSSFS